MGINPYSVGPFYTSMDDVRDKIFEKGLSLTSQFKVSLFLSSGSSSSDDVVAYLNKCGLLDKKNDPTRYDFMCSEAVLPGSTFDMAEEYGSHQGVIERFPTRRIYSDFNLTFYVDREYNLIRLFEEWMNFIDPLYTEGSDNKLIKYGGSPSGQSNSNYLNRNAFFRFKYPESYKRTIAITKFERDYVDKRGNPRSTQSLTYQFVDAFPTNLTALPLSYEGSTITKTTINFGYSRYIVMKNNAPLRDDTPAGIILSSASNSGGGTETVIDDVSQPAVSSGGEQQTGE